MNTITVFTTTYNRAYVLPQLYVSLCNQTNRNFDWLIIDDGSIDNSKELIDGWIKEGKIQIRYIYKENGGMHTGHNLAYKNISTELNICIDSDDYMPENAIELILNFWSENKNQKYAGILGLDIYKDGSLVSNKSFPANVKSGKYYSLKGKYGLSGDIKFVYRTDVIKNYPEYPVFPNERFTPLGYKYLLIDQDYDMLFFNKALCVVEYMPDGSTMNIFKQYVNNPRGFLHERKIRMVKAYSFKERMTNTIHYIATSLLIKSKRIVLDSPKKFLTIILYPFGLMLYMHLLKINKNEAKKNG